MDLLKQVATALTPKTSPPPAPAKNAGQKNAKVNEKKPNNKVNIVQKQVQNARNAEKEAQIPQKEEVENENEGTPTTGDTPAQGVRENSVEAFRLLSESDSAEGGGGRRRRRRRSRKTRKHKKHSRKTRGRKH